MASCLRLKTLRLEENCLSIGSIPEELLLESQVSLLCIDGNLFKMKEFEEVPGYSKVRMPFLMFSPVRLVFHFIFWSCCLPLIITRTTCLFSYFSCFLFSSFMHHDIGRLLSLFTLKDKYNSFLFSCIVFLPLAVRETDYFPASSHQLANLFVLHLCEFNFTFQILLCYPLLFIHFLYLLSFFITVHGEIHSCQEKNVLNLLEPSHLWFRNFREKAQDTYLLMR